MVAMLAPGRPCLGLATVSELSEILEQETSRHVRRLDIATERDAYFMLWPKDGFCDWGTFVAVGNAPGLAAFVASFGKPTYTDEALSEGGMFVRSGVRVLVSSALPSWAALPTDQRIVRLPHPYSSDLYRRHQPEHQPLTHLDLDVALVPCGKNPLLLVSERYLHSYRSSVAAAAECLGLDVIEIPQAEAAKRGLNLVVLSEQAVLLPAGCRQLSGLLVERLGKESVIEVLIDDDFNYNGGRGGLGCMSNVVWETLP